MALGWKVMGAGVEGLALTALLQDVGTSISAAGTTQGTATELKTASSEVTTVSSGAGVILSSLLAPGDEQLVYNAGANALKIYPPSNFKINSLAANAPMILGTNSAVFFKCISTTRVFGILSA